MQSLLQRKKYAVRSEGASPGHARHRDPSPPHRPSRSDFFVGRLGSSFWGGYWCGRWHVARPNTGVGVAMSPGYTSGDPRRGWDHLAWHHLAYVFAGDSTLVRERERERERGREGGTERGDLVARE
jgi:hypothetical protein